MSRNIGIIGLDAMHAVALTKAINRADPAENYLGYRVTAAYPHGSRTLEYRKARVPEYTNAVKEMGVKIVDSIAALLKQVDKVILASNDGHVHREQALPVIKAGKPLFIDKPLAGTWDDAVTIFHAAQQYETPVFTSSSLRFISDIQRLDKNQMGAVLGAHTFSPASFEASLPELLWYGIHGIEMLFAVMGPGCMQVQRAFTEDYDHLIGIWEDGRVGTFRGLRKGQAEYGGVVFGEKENVTLGGFEGYQPLAQEMVKFFETNNPPVRLEESLEIMAFIIAAEESKKNGGIVVQLNTKT